MPSRNDVAAALLAKLAGAYAFTSTSRRNRDPQRIGPSQAPCLFLLDHEESYTRPSPDVPPVREIAFVALVYVDVGNNENAIPAAVMNDILDALDVALAGDPCTGRETLGGLVFSCTIDGTIERSSGDMTGKAAAAVPISVVLIP
jgi:hypothetical protein